MKLIEALEILKRPVSETAPASRIFLACGFTPLHLQTFLAAHFRRLLPERDIAIQTGLFGDLCGNIERLAHDTEDSVCVVVEWSDLDPRLGLRTLGGWQPARLPDILQSVRQTGARLKRGIAELATRTTTVVCLPTLPLPPLFSTRPGQAGPSEIELQSIVASFATDLAQSPGVRIVSAALLGTISPLANRYDLKSDVMSGFPYSLPHASAVGEVLAGLLWNRAPKKGLITDLDDTLWAGILGEDGVDGISWHLDRHTHIHGVYQQFLASLAGAGVMIAVASKNDPAMVERVFDRKDLLLGKNDIFPLEVHWSRKSESVGRILSTWNVNADSVVFIDDSPMEVAEVQTSFPEMECILFPRTDYQRVWTLLHHLRDIFGKSLLTEDDSLRLQSIRNAQTWRESIHSGNSADDFLKNSEACVAFDFAQSDGDARAFELVNKTNQFNLNGKRYTESEWRTFFSDPKAFALAATYTDKFGPLGKIAVIMGKSSGRRVSINTWVMSCRAFSRRIEHQSLNYLFSTLGAVEIAFDYQSTSRNGPLREFFEELGIIPATGPLVVSREQFAAKVPALFHRVEGTVHV